MKVGQAFSIAKGRKAPTEHEKQVSKSLRYLQIKDLRNDKSILYASDPKGVVSEVDDILIAWDGANSGTVATNLHGYVGSTLARLRCNAKDEIYTPYAAKFLQSQFFTLNSNTTGSTIPHVSKIVLENLDVPLPPLEQQKRIAAILDKADELRAKRRRAIAKLDELLKSVFLELFGDPRINSKSWIASTVDDIATRVTDGEHITPQRVQEGIKLLSARNVQNGYLDYSKGLDYIPQTEYERIKKRCNPEFGDILISCSGSIGRVAQVVTHEPLSMVRSVALIKPNRSALTSTYLEHYLRTDYSHSIMQKSARQSSQANLFLGQIKLLPVLLPPKALQDSFDSQVAEIDHQKEQLTRAESLMETLFRSLQARAFSGDLTTDALDKVETVTTSS